MKLPKSTIDDMIAAGATMGPGVKIPSAGIEEKDGARTPAGGSAEIVTLHLPWPPSVNHYWRHVGARVLISQAGREYRQCIRSIVTEQVFLQGHCLRVEGRLSVFVAAHPPDRRKRDLDNLMKAVLDSLQHAGVYESDEQIDMLTIHRSSVRHNGELYVIIRPLGGPHA